MCNLVFFQSRGGEPSVICVRDKLITAKGVHRVCEWAVSRPWVSSEHRVCEKVVDREWLLNTECVNRWWTLRDFWTQIVWRGGGSWVITAHRVCEKVMNPEWFLNTECMSSWWTLGDFWTECLIRCWTLSDYWTESAKNFSRVHLQYVQDESISSYLNCRHFLSQVNIMKVG